MTPLPVLPSLKLLKELYLSHNMISNFEFSNTTSVGSFFFNLLPPQITIFDVTHTHTHTHNNTYK